MTSYDEIIAYHDKGLPGFKEKQMGAAEAISNVIKKLPVKRIWDLGCGTAEITNKLSRCFPEKKLIGIDNSKKSIAVAQKMRKNANVSYRYGDMDILKPRCEDLVMSVGNTLIHFGEKNFKNWLHNRQKNKSLPSFIFLDFICDWDKIVRKGNLFKIFSYEIKNNALFLSGLNTVRIENKIVRELIVVKIKDDNVVTKVIPVEQYADPTGAYYGHLKDYGYVLSKKTTYEHGYGLMRGTLWSLK